MPSSPTPRMGLVVDALDDGPPDGPNVFLNQLATPIDTAVALYDQGTLALRPTSTPGTPGIEGRFYMVVGDTDHTKNGILWYDYGTGWFPVAFGSLDIDYATQTSPVTVTAPNEGASTTIISGHSVAYDGGRVMIEIWLPHARGDLFDNNGDLTGVVYRDSTVLGRTAIAHQDSRGITSQGNLSVKVFDTPSAGNHVYSLRGYTENGITWTVDCGPGGSGHYLPGFLHVVKAS